MGIRMYSRMGVWENRTMEGPREEATGPLKMQAVLSPSHTLVLSH